MNQVVTRLKILISEKELREHRRLTYDVIKQEADVSRSTINDWVKNNARRYDSETIAKFCTYFNCDIGDLLALVPNGK